MSEQKLTAIQFIEGKFIPDMERAIDGKLQYYVFPLICQCIELMGAMYDANSFDAKKQSEGRFKRALKKLFKDERYKNNQTMFFEHLRGNMIHQLRPGSNFKLASIKHDNADPKLHLDSFDKDKRILLIEPFFEDFKKAFNTLKQDASRTDKGVDNNKKELSFVSYGHLPAPIDEKYVSSKAYLSCTSNSQNVSG